MAGPLAACLCASSVGCEPWEVPSVEAGRV